MKIIRTLALTVCIYSFLGWIYIAANAVVHPETLPLPLSHMTLWIREDTFGFICFIFSFLSFFVWRLTKPNR